MRAANSLCHGTRGGNAKSGVGPPQPLPLPRPPLPPLHCGLHSLQWTIIGSRNLAIKSLNLNHIGRFPPPFPLLDNPPSAPPTATHFSRHNTTLAVYPADVTFALVNHNRYASTETASVMDSVYSGPVALGTRRLLNGYRLGLCLLPSRSCFSLYIRAFGVF